MSKTQSTTQVHPYGYIKEGNVYVSGYDGLTDRKIGVVKESDEASISYFEERFAKLQEKVEEVANAINESQNKGSFLMKLVHIRESLAEYNGLGDFVALKNRIIALEEGIEKYISENRLKNIQIKTALLEEAKILKDSSDWDEVAETLKDLKMRWIRTGSVGENDEELSAQFDAYLDEFFDRRKAFFDEERRIADERMDSYRKITNRLRKINYHKEKTPELRQEVIDLQRAWKDVGQVPKWKYLKIYKNYKREVDKFFGNTEMPAKPVIPTQPDEILKYKGKLADEVEKIASEFTNVQLNKVKTYQSEWKQMGILKNNDEDRDLNTRFHSACSELFTHVFLENEARNNYEGYDDKTGFEKLKLKLKLIKDSIREDEPKLQEIAQAVPRDHYGRPMFDNNNPAHKPIRSEYMNLLNVIKTKKRLAKKFQAQLDSSYM